MTAKEKLREAVEELSELEAEKALEYIATRINGSDRDDPREDETPSTPMHLEERDGVPVAVAEREMPTLTVTQVRQTLEQTRR
jgi:hypothetical protein